MPERCWFADLPDAGPCDGRLVRVHLIPRSLLKREFPYGAVLTWNERPGGLTFTTSLGPARRDEADALRSKELAGVTLREMIDDPRTWVRGCGGPMGNGGHNGMLDSSRTVRIPRHRLPVEVEVFAAEVGLGWWLDREYKW